MKKLATALAATSLLIGATIWAADDSSTQPGASSQSSQSSQAGSSDQSQWSSQPGQSSQTGQSAGQSAMDAAQSQAGQSGDTVAEAASAEFQRISQNPQEFIQHAYQNNLTEIQLGQLAQQKGQSQDVKQFGQHLIQGHQALNDKLTQLASQKNIQLSKQLDARHQKMVDRLQALNGADFDKRFMREQVMTHRRDVALYQRASQNNTDTDVKSFAQTSLPALREHLQMAQQQAGSINEAAGAGQQGQGQSGMTPDQYKSQGQQSEGMQQQGQEQQPAPQPQPQPQQ